MADVTIDYTNGIVLQVNEATRTITNGGKDTPIILGVKGDDCAERIYFEIPKHLSSFITDVTKEGILNTDNESTIVYVNFKNAMHDIYIEELILLRNKDGLIVESEEGNPVFYWEVTNNATEAKGEVKFNICVKRSTRENAEAVEWKLQNEWHTTMFTGKVLDSVDVSRTSPTPEVIVHDTITFQTLNKYAAAYNNWSQTLSSMDGYVDSEVEASVNLKMSDYALKTDLNSYLPLSGGAMTGNIEMSAGGIIYKDGMNADEYAGFCIAPQGEPVIISKDLSLCFTTSEDYVMYTHEYKFPQNSGTLLLDTLRSGEGIHCQDGGFFSAGGYPAIATSDGSLFVSSGQFNTSQGVWLRFPTKPGNLALEPTTQTLYQGNTAEIDARSASENTYYSIDIALSKVPTVGSKLKIYFGDGKNASPSQYNTFVLDLIVSEGADDIIVGQTSHYILMKDPDASKVSFEGIMNVNLYSSENTLDCLHVNLLVKTFDDYVISGTGLERSVQFCVNKVEMITEN